MITPGNLSAIDDSILKVNLKSQEGKASITSWNVTRIKGNTMNIVLVFNDPLLVSIGVSIIHFVLNSMVIAKSRYS